MASIIKEHVHPFLNTLDTKFKGNSLLETFEKKTHYPKSYAIIGAGAFYFFLIIFNLGGIGQMLCNFIGFIVPTYYSLKALRTKTTTDDSDLLIYWVVYAFFTIAEFWVNSLLRWIPFYFVFKTLFLVYIAFPQFGGAKLLYFKFIEPLSERFIFKSHTTAHPPTPNARPLEKEFSETMENIVSENTKATGFSHDSSFS